MFDISLDRMTKTNRRTAKESSALLHRLKIRSCMFAPGHEACFFFFFFFDETSLMSLRLEGFGEESLGTKGKQKKKGSRANGGRGGPHSCTSCV